VPLSCTRDPSISGREISSEVADSQRSVILNQVENGIAVRMAVLERVLMSVEQLN
jgi:aspartate carbamoyltransferase catalytic subunit